MMTGVEFIGQEREKQLGKWDAEHDDAHTQGELGLAAASLILNDTDPGTAEGLWPWELVDLHRHTCKARVDQLSIAGALIAAEIDRIMAEAY